MADTKTSDGKIQSGSMNQAGHAQQGSDERFRSEAKQSENQTMQQGRAKAEVSHDRDSSKTKEKSAIGGSEKNPPTSKTGEPGRARDELNKADNR